MAPWAEYEYIYTSTELWYIVGVRHSHALYAKIGEYVSYRARTAQGNDQELTQTVKWKLDIP